MKRLALILVLAACGPDVAPPGEQAYGGTEEALKAPTCVPDESNTKPLIWACDTVKAMQILSLEVTNADGSKPWTTGAPRLSASVRNTSDRFINYPGMRFEARGLGTVTEQRYGLFGCDVTEMVGPFSRVPPSGTRVTFKAIPISLSETCRATTLSVTVTAP